LAEELTSRIHGEASLAGIQQVSALLFDPKFDAAQLGTLSPAQFDIIGEEIPKFHVTDDNNEMPMDGLLTEMSNIFPSKSELRRAVQSNALSINKIKITAHDHNITQNDFVAGKYILVENGKKNKYLLVFNQ
jgi:tyrosyl-tRNA synthetase